MCQLCRAAGVQYGAEHVGNMGERDQLVRVGQHVRHRIEIDVAVFRERRHIDLCADPFGQQLPRHDIRMMLQLGQHDPVARSDTLVAPAVRDEIDRLGRAARKHDFAVGCRADKFGYPPARHLIGQRHIGRARIDPAMHGRIALAITGRDRIDHRLRLLRRRGRI